MQYLTKLSIKHQFCQTLLSKQQFISKVLPIQINNFATNLNLKTLRLIYEREIRQNLAKIDLLTQRIPDQDQNKSRTLEDLRRFSQQFQNLLFSNDVAVNPTQPQSTLDEQSDSQKEIKQEMEFKKLVTVTKSKFYMLKINYPKAFEEISKGDLNSGDSDMSKQLEERLEKQEEHNPLDENAAAAKSLKEQGQQQQTQMKGLADNGAAVSLDDDESPENRQKLRDLIEKDKQKYASLDSQTEELMKGLQSLKRLEQMNPIDGQEERFKNIKYVEREEDLELKKLYEEEIKQLQSMSKNLAGKIDGEIDMDLHGNVTFRNMNNGTQEGQNQTQEEVKEGIQGSGTYVLRNGKLVPGQGETREQAQYSNWYCSNADPEDIRRHRELMDRMNYRGPKWEGIGVPKSVLEEFNPRYRKVEGEEHPSQAHPEKEGKKEFEYVVR
eukprot:403338547